MVEKPRKAFGHAAWKQGSGFEIFYILDAHATVFQAEVKAITQFFSGYAGRKLQGKVCSDLL